jgi:hypothetical protein
MTDMERQHRLAEAAWSRATTAGTWSLAVSVVDVDERTGAASPDWRTDDDEGAANSTTTDHIGHWRATGRRMPIARLVPPASQLEPADFPTTLFNSSALIPAP